MYSAKLYFGRSYHIFNHSIEEVNLFRRENDYFYFLKLFDRHISPVAYVFAYCLMPNHFHFLVRIKNREEISKNLKINKDESQFLTRKFSNLFNSYAKTYNKIYRRRGRLFLYPYKRRLISDIDDFFSVMAYIHNNPVHHNFVEKAEDWKWSSFCSFYSAKTAEIIRKEIAKEFKSKDDFIDFHKNFPIEKFAVKMDLTY